MKKVVYYYLLKLVLFCFFVFYAYRLIQDFSWFNGIMCIIFLISLTGLQSRKQEFFRSDSSAPLNPQSDTHVDNKSGAISKPDSFTSSAVSTEPVIEKPKEPKPDIVVPHTKDGAPMQYNYRNQEILDLDFDVAMKAANENSWELSAKVDGDRISLYYNDSKIGYLGGTHVDMLQDWIKRNDPYTIYLEGIDSENKTAIAFLIFYRDNRKYMSFREQTTVKLTSYRKQDSQMVIAFLNEGEELELSEEYNDNSGNEYVAVEESSVEIGRLPKKVADRYLNEGAAACYFDHSDYDDEKDIYIPYVVIYW